MEYKDLNEETKRFLKNAMNIYKVIKDKPIKKKIRDLVRKEQDYEFKKIDKKVLSLFIASFFTDGNIKDMFSEFEDIKLSDLLEFIDTKEEEIIPMDESEYELFFDKNFKYDLITIVNNSNRFSNVEKITPESLISCLQYSHNIGTRILDYYSDKYSLDQCITGINNHPLFNTIHNYCLSKGFITKKEVKDKRLDTPFASMLGGLMFGSERIRQKLQEQENPESKKLEEKKASKLNLNDDELWDKLVMIQKMFIGQEEAVKNLFYNIVNNQEMVGMDMPRDQFSTILLDGPSGTGKTAIIEQITKSLGIPFKKRPITDFSATGYVGGDLTDILVELYNKANQNLEEAQRGIVVLEEFDKIALNGDDLRMKRAVQDQLLDFLGGGKYTIPCGKTIFDHDEVEFDTSKLTFICLGAFTDLRSKKTEQKSMLGFTPSLDEKQDLDYEITSQDLIDAGFRQELVGRLNTRLHTNDYSKEDLMNILKNSPISPLIGFKKWVEAYHKDLIIDEDVYELIVDFSYSLNLGARGLDIVMSSVRTLLMEEVLRGKNSVVVLNSDTVLNACNNITKRKGRK